MEDGDSIDAMMHQDGGGYALVMTWSRVKKVDTTINQIDRRDTYVVGLLYLVCLLD